MANYQAIHDAIRARFATEVEAVVPVAVAYDNGPDFGSARSPYGVPNPRTDRWARAAVLPGSALVAENADGTNVFRTLGQLLVSTYGPPNKGDGALLDLVDAVVSAFRGVQLADVRFHAPTPGRGRRDGAWWRIDVSCPFVSEEIA